MNRLMKLFLFFSCLWIYFILSFISNRECTSYVADWYYSNKRGKYIYGGFTADIGWILMVARYAYSTDHEFEFPNHWGHSGAGLSWDEMFIQPSNCINKITIEAKTNQKLRQKIKFKDYYTNNPLYKIHPNKNIQKRFGMHGVSVKDDLSTMRVLFKRIFVLNTKSRFKIDRLKTKISEPYIGVHIRWGDKIGKGSVNDPIESVMIPLETYVDEIQKMNLKTIFVATDDHKAVIELSKLLPHYKIITSANVDQSGFSINDYQPDLLGTLQLWSDMEMLAGAKYFIGNFESNVARTVHLMRSTESIDIMNVHKSESQRQCCKIKYNNCFWFCNY
jgi:hypothetical protein